MKCYQENDKLCNGQDVYVIEQVLRGTENSCTYRVNQVNDNYRYFVKQQTISRGEAEQAKEISNQLNQKAVSEVGTPLELALPVNKIFEFKGDMFLLMPYYDDGMFLEEIISKQLMDTADIFEFFERILRNTERMHYLPEKESSGLLHLDIHPGNIFCCNVDKDVVSGGLKLEGVRYIDFSEACSMHEGESKQIDATSNRRAVKGYRAPELLKDQNGKIEVSRGTDIFSLTAILLFMLKKKVYSEYEMNDDTVYFYSDITLNDEAAEKLGLDMITLNLLNQFLYTGLAIDRKLRFNQDTHLYIKCFKDVFSSYQAFQRGKINEVIELGFKYNLLSIHNEYLPWERMKFLLPKPSETEILSMYKSAVLDLSEKLLQPKVDNRNNAMHAYVFRILGDMYNRFENFFEIKPDGETKAILAAAGIAVYNNLGKAIDAKKYLELWDKNKQFVSPETILFTATKIPGYYENILDFGQALKEAEANVKAQESIKESLKAAVEKSYEFNYPVDSEAIKSPVYAKSLSACGRYYSFLGEKDEAEKSFINALAAFKSDDTVNIKRTRGYYAHWAIEFGKEDKFGEIFLGRDSWCGCMEKLCRNMDEIPGYDFLIFIKGFHAFGKEADQKEIEKLVPQFKEIIEKGEIYTQHPWGLIYRHLGSIFMEAGGDGMKDWADKAFQLACRRMDDDEKNFTLETIFAYHSYFIWCSHKNRIMLNKKEVDARWDKLSDWMSACGIRDKTTGVSDIDRMVNILNSLFKYEFA